MFKVLPFGLETATIPNILQKNNLDAICVKYIDGIYKPGKIIFNILKDFYKSLMLKFSN